MHIPPKWLPEKPMWSNYYEALTFMPFGRYFLNTSFIVVTVLIGTILSASFVGLWFCSYKGWIT